MASLDFQDKIEFLVGGQSKYIELYYGDITCLPLDQKVDLLMISAYHGT